MGRVTCRCGNVISTSRDTLRYYRGDLLPEVCLDNWDAEVSLQLRAIIKAVENGKPVAEFVETYSTSETVAEALLSWKINGEAFFNLSREVLQCYRCGRLLVEINRRNEFRTFLPESDGSHHILDA
jgi:hypothetical protein